MTTTLPDHLRDLVEFQARLYRDAKVENKYPMMESHTALQWLASDSQAEYDEANRVYRELAEV